MIGKLVSRTLASAALAAGLAGNALAIPVTVDSVEAMNPNPNALTMVDAVSNGSTPNGVTLANFQAMMMGANGAYQRNRGGVLDFQQQFQGGTWPNATSASNGVDVGNGPTNLVTARYGAALNANVQFYRLPGATAQDAIDSNTNQGTNVVSGGGMTQNGGGTANVDFSTVPPSFVTPPAGSVSGGGYMGVTGAAAIELQFLTPLRAFGITGLPRGATRTTQLTFTLTDNTTFQTTADVVGTSAVFYGAQLTPAQAATPGLGISRVAFAHPLGVNRYDDLAFIPIPEPSSISLLLLAGLSAVVRRRR